MGLPVNRPHIVQVQGGKIHRDTCPTVRGLAHVSIDAENSGALARMITRDGTQPCRRCKPITGLAIYERQQRSRDA